MSIKAFTKEQIEELLWLGEQIPGGFFIYRADEIGELIYANKTMLEIFGCDSMEELRELTGGTFRGLVHPDDYPKIQASIEEQISDQKNKKIDYVEYRIVRKDGEIRWIDDYGHLAEIPGYGNAYYVFITDVTDKVRAREEKLRIEMELLQERQRAEIRQNFLFDMNHDIRTPMNVMVGFSELAKRHCDDPELVKEYLDKAVISGRQVMNLFNDMLEINTLEKDAIELTPEPAELRHVIDTAIEPFRTEAENKNISLTGEVDPPNARVIVDSYRLQQIMGNLISNAVKFTPAGGSIRVRVWQDGSEQQGRARFAFQVADTGVGMTKEFMGRMWGVFEREETSTNTGILGTGLGLPIVEHLVDQMGGEVRVRSEKGKGTTFTVYLPLELICSDGVRAAAQVDREPESSEEKYRILIVEDIEFNRDLAESLLEDEGFLVESAENGQEAVDMVKESPMDYYDLILMDIQMPVMDGYEATRAIRAMNREDTPYMPIVALSANSTGEDKRRSLESGMNFHVSKPFEIDLLVATINEQIAARENSGEKQFFHI